MMKFTKSIDANQASAETIPPTWPAMVLTDRRLFAVASLAAAQREAGGGWYRWERVKKQLQRLVGWFAEDRRLATQAHYDEAYRTVLEVFEGDV